MHAQATSSPRKLLELSSTLNLDFTVSRHGGEGKRDDRYVLTSQN